MTTIDWADRGSAEHRSFMDEESDIIINHGTKYRLGADEGEGE